MAHRRHTSRGGGVIPAPAARAPDPMAAMLLGQYGPAFKAVTDRVRNPRSNVMLLPRTTAYLPESERQRRIYRYGRDKPPDLLSNGLLRTIASKSIINVAIHAVRRARVRQVARHYDGVPGRPGWAIVHREHFNPEFDAKQIQGLKRRIAEVERLFDAPHARFEPSIGGLLVKLAEDNLAIDRVAINLMPGKLDGLATQGPVAFAHVDGATIWPVDLYLDHLVQLNGFTRGDGSADLDAGLRAFYEETGVRLEDCTHLQVDPTRGPTPLAYLDERTIHVAVSNPSPEIQHWGFGRSPCEESYIAASVILHGLAYVAGFFRDALADVIGVLSGETYDDADVQSLVQILRTHHSGSGAHHYYPVVTVDQKGDLEFIQTRHTTPKDTMFDETMHRMLSMACAPYSIDPTEVNVEQKGPGQGGIGGERNREQERAAKRDLGDYNLLHLLAEQLTIAVVRRHDPELMFTFLGLDDEDEKQALELRTKGEDYHVSIDEARRAEGKEPFGEEWSKWPKWRAQQVAQQADQAEAQKRQAQMQGGPGGEQPDQGGEQRAPGGEQGGPGGEQQQRQAEPPPPAPMPPHMGWDEAEAGKASPEAAGLVEFYAAEDGP